MSMLKVVQWLQGNPGMFYLLAMLFGGAGKAVLDRVLHRQETEFRIGHKLREELRAELQYLKGQNEDLKVKLEQMEERLTEGELSN